MKIKFLLLSVYLLSMGSALAEESEAAHSEPSIMDLKYPVLNFVIFAGFIIWKAKKPLSEMFNKKAQDVKSLMDSAEKQSKDANEKLNSLQGKIKNIDSELVKITADYAEEVLNFSNTQKQETATTISRMQRDVKNKIEGEKKEMLDDLSHEVLNLVVSKTQATIKGSQDLKSKATNNIVLGLK